jgi:hypothetical protein
MESPLQPTLRTPNSWVRMHRARPLYASLTITTGAREAPSDQFFHQPPAFRHLPHVPEAPLIQVGVLHAPISRLLSPRNLHVPSRSVVLEAADSVIRHATYRISGHFPRSISRHSAVIVMERMRRAVA